MPVGVIVLIGLTLFTLAGLGHRVYDRMRLTDAQALVFLLLLIAGSFISVPVLRGPLSVSINLGGAVVPLALAVFVLSRAGTGTEWWRAVIATVITGGVLYGVAKLMRGFGHGRDIIDPLYIYGIVAGLVGYAAAGRSRRSAFIGATLGTLLLDVFNLVELVARGAPGTVMIGGAGAFDAIVIAGVLSVLTAELLGESLERIQGGPVRSEDRPEGLTIGAPGENQEKAGHRTEEEDQ